MIASAECRVEGQPTLDAVQFSPKARGVQSPSAKVEGKPKILDGYAATRVLGGTKSPARLESTAT